MRPPAGSMSFFPVEKVDAVEANVAGGVAAVEGRPYADEGARLQLEVVNSFLFDTDEESDHMLAETLHAAKRMATWAAEATLAGDICVVQGTTAPSQAAAATPSHALISSFVLPATTISRQLVAVQPANAATDAAPRSAEEVARYGSLGARRLPTIELVGRGDRPLIPFCYSVTAYYHGDTNALLRLTDVRSLCLEHPFAVRNFLSYVLRMNREVTNALMASSGFKTAATRRDTNGCRDEGLLLPPQAEVFPGVDRLRQYAALVDSLLRHDTTAGSCREKKTAVVRAAIARLLPQENLAAAPARSSVDCARQDILKAARGEGMLVLGGKWAAALDCTTLRVMFHPESVRFFAGEELAALEEFFPAYYLTGLGVERVHALYLDLFEGGARKKLASDAAEAAAEAAAEWDDDEGEGEGEEQGGGRAATPEGPSLSPAFCMYLIDELGTHCPSSLEFGLSIAADRILRGLGARDHKVIKPKAGDGESLDDDDDEEGATSDEEWYHETMLALEAEDEANGGDDEWHPPPEEGEEGEERDGDGDLVMGGDEGFPAAPPSGDDSDDELWVQSAALCAELEGATDAELELVAAAAAAAEAEREKGLVDELEEVDWEDFDEPARVTAYDMPAPRPSDHFALLMAEEERRRARRDGEGDGEDAAGSAQPAKDWRGFNRRETPYGYTMADYVARPEDEKVCNHKTFGVPRLSNPVRLRLSFAAFATLAAKHPRSGISFQEVLDAAALEQMRIYTNVVGHASVPFIVVRTRLLQRLGVDTTSDVERRRGAVDGETMRRFSNWHEKEGKESTALDKALTEAKAAFWGDAGGSGSSAALSSLLALSFARLSAFGALVLADGPHADTGLVAPIDFTLEEVADTEEVAAVATAFQEAIGVGDWKARRFGLSIKTAACSLLAGRMLEATVYLEENFRYERCLLESSRRIFERSHSLRRAALSAASGWQTEATLIEDDLTPFERAARAPRPDFPDGWDYPTRKAKARHLNAFLAALEQQSSASDRAPAPDSRAAALRHAVPEEEHWWIEQEIIGRIGWQRRVSMCDYPPSAEQLLFIRMLERGLPMALVQGAAGAGKSYAIAHWVHMLLPGTVLFVGFMHAQKDSIAVTLTSGEFPYPDLPPGLTAHQLLTSHQFVCGGRMRPWRGVAAPNPNLDRERRHGFVRTADYRDPVRASSYCFGKRVKRAYVDEAGTMGLSLASALANLFADESCFPVLRSVVWLGDTRQNGAVEGGALGSSLAIGLGPILFMNNRRYESASSCLSMAALRAANPDDFVIKVMSAKDVIEGRASDRASDISLVQCDPAPLFSLPTAEEFLARKGTSPALAAIEERRTRERVAAAAALAGGAGEVEQAAEEEEAEEDIFHEIDRTMAEINQPSIDIRAASTGLLPVTAPERADMLSQRQLAAAIEAGAEAARDKEMAEGEAGAGEPPFINRLFTLVGGGGEAASPVQSQPMEVDEESNGGWSSEDESGWVDDEDAFMDGEGFDDDGEGYFSGEDEEGAHFAAPSGYRDPHSEHSMMAMHTGGASAASGGAEGSYASGTQWLDVAYKLGEREVVNQEDCLFVTSTNKEARLIASVLRPFFAAGMPEIPGTNFFVGERLALVGKNFSNMNLENRSIIRLLGAVRVKYIYLNAEVTKDLVEPLVLSLSLCILSAIASACRPRTQEPEAATEPAAEAVSEPAAEAGAENGDPEGEEAAFGASSSSATDMNSVSAATMRLLLSDVDAESAAGVIAFDDSPIASAISCAASICQMMIRAKANSHGLDFLEIGRLVHRSLLSMSSKNFTGAVAKAIASSCHVPDTTKSYRAKVLSVYKRTMETTGGNKKEARKAARAVQTPAAAEAYDTLVHAVFAAVCTRIYVENLDYATELGRMSSSTRALPLDDTRLASTENEYFAARRHGRALHVPLPRAALRKSVEFGRITMQKQPIDVSPACYLAASTDFLQGRAPKSLGEIRAPTSKQKIPSISTHSVRAFLCVRAEGEGRLAYVPENPDVTNYLRSPVARTSHAAQSQDEPHVYVALNSRSMATHKFQYTAATRHEKTCCVLGSVDTVAHTFTDAAVPEAEYSLLGQQIRVSILEPWLRRVSTESGGVAMQQFHAALEEARAQQIDETRLEPTVAEAQAVEDFLARKRARSTDDEGAPSAEELATARRDLLGQLVLRRALRCNRSVPMLLPWEAPLQDVLSPTHVAAAAVSDELSGGAVMRFDRGDRAMIPRASPLYGVCGPPEPKRGGDSAHLQHTWASTPLAALRARVAATPIGEPPAPCEDISSLFPDTDVFRRVFKATIYEPQQISSR